MRETIKGLKIRKRTEVTLDDIARELNPMVRGWIAYYGRYTRSALYPLARYLNQTLAVWMKRKYKRFHRRLGRARTSLRRSRVRTEGSSYTGSLAMAALA